MLGLARVDLSDLDFSHAGANGHRQEDRRNVDRLVQVFRIEGCDRAEEKHFIRGYVDQTELPLPLPQQKPRAFTNENVASIPRLQIKVRCNEGLHRILAARQYLEEGDQWWVIRLFDASGMVSASMRVSACLTM